MLVGGRLALGHGPVSHLCTPVNKSHLSVLHFFVVCLTIQLKVVLVFCQVIRPSRCSSLRSSNCGLTVLVRLKLSSTLAPPTVKKTSHCN